MPDGAERDELMQKMSRSSTAYAPWKITRVPLRERARVSVGRSATSTTAFNQHPWPYLDIDLQACAARGTVAVSDPVAGALASRAIERHGSPVARSHAQRAGQRPGPTWADPAKTLRVVLPIAETGFDPQADVGPLLEPVNSRDLRAAVRVRLSRAAAQLVPQHGRRAARDLGRTGARGRSGSRRASYFADDPAFKGKKRELTAQDYVYRVEAPARPERALAVPVVSRRQARRRRQGAREGEGSRASSTTTREIEGLRALDRYTLQLKLAEPDYVTAGLHVARRDGGGRARGRSKPTATRAAGRWPTRSAPARSGSRNGGAAQRIVLEANPDLPRGDVSRAAREADADARALHRAR